MTKAKLTPTRDPYTKITGEPTFEWRRTADGEKARAVLDLGYDVMEVRHPIVYSGLHVGGYTHELHRVAENLIDAVVIAHGIEDDEPAITVQGWRKAKLHEATLIERWLDAQDEAMADRQRQIAQAALDAGLIEVVDGKAVVRG